VSNEVGSGIVPAFRSGRVYRDMLGRLNQEVAAIADNVILMVAGIPLPVKGRLTSRRRV
jgi:adenosylcobinamide kinase / adenosylcobinamide-phosphate guanylyltransferase